VVGGMGIGFEFALGGWWVRYGRIVKWVEGEDKGGVKGLSSRGE